VTPQELSVLTTVLQTLSELPIGALLVVIFVLPWLALLIYTWLMRGMIDKFRDQFQQETRESRERFEAVVQMYESNAALVENYERLCTDQQDIIISNTQTIQRLTDRLEK
jgi:hypothetical protein